jgi:hypothetical protein
MRFSIIFIILLHTLKLLSQNTSTWSQYAQLYSDSYITVEISFKIAQNGCDFEENITSSKYRYRVTGRARYSEYYLNWKMDYIDCNGNFYSRNNSLNVGSSSKEIFDELNDHVIYNQDEEFTCKSLIKPFYDVNLSTSKIVGTKLLALPNSQEPNAISGKTNIEFNEETRLSVVGGQLGIGADWEWYENSCGKGFIGKGESIKVSPKKNTTYYVRAVGKNNTTNCVSVLVNVNQNSIKPERIIGDDRVCFGESTILSVYGGNLGLDAEWVWYEGGCEGKPIGKGTSIAVAPKSSTFYYVKADGKTNKTDCREIFVKVLDSSLEPNFISGNKDVCQGDNIKLKVNGGRLASDASWIWYSNYCGGKYIGSGEEINLYPNETTTYYVRAEGKCGNTNCKSITVSVEKKSTKPDYIETQSSIYKNKKTKISATGGFLNNNSKWVWYLGSCYDGEKIGTGSSIKYKFKKPSYLYVKAEGACKNQKYNSDCAIKYIYPNDKSSTGKFYPTYKQSIKQKFGLGLAVGADVTNVLTPKGLFTNTGIASSNTTSKELILTGYGVAGEFNIYPILKPRISLNLIISGAFGTSDFLSVTSGGERNFVYTKANIIPELAFGFPAFKLLFSYRNTFQKLDYKRELNSGATINTTSFNSQIRKEIYSGGFRFGRYVRKKDYKYKGVCFDILYNHSYNYSWDWKNPSWNFNRLDKAQFGLGIALWVQNLFKVQVDVLGDWELKTYTANNSFVQVSLLYNKNWFK